MRALRREPTEHFQMSYIEDETDYSIPLEKENGRARKSRRDQGAEQKEY